MSTAPTVTAATAWSADSLLRAAEGWEQAATDLQNEVDGVVSGVDSTQDFWTGSAADNMRDRIHTVTGAGMQLTEAMLTAAVEARQGAERIEVAGTAVTTLVDRAYRMGCMVADNGTVSPPAIPPAEAVVRVGGDLELARRFMDGWCAHRSLAIAAALQTLGDTDTDVAQRIDAAFASPGARTVTTATGWSIPPADVVAGWAALSQDRIAAQIAALTPAQRHQLVTEFPHEVGNTDGVPWDMRTEANRLNIADAIVEQRRLLEQSEDDKLLALVREAFPDWSPGSAHGAAALLLTNLLVNPTMRRQAVTRYDDAVNRRIEHYTGLLGTVPDPTGQSTTAVDRQILAFDPPRSSFIELTGDLATADHIGVFVPGVNTTVMGSASNLETTRRIVEAGEGDIAMLTYLGGPFPDADTWDEYANAADPHYATEMAPRLVAFSEDVNRMADSLGREVSVTVIGHSYGGSILGTAESMGLTADRTLYIAAAGAGVGVDDPSDWHNRNPDVVRYAMTAPGDWIEYVQGVALGQGPHGADVDDLSGVVRLETGDYADGTPLQGWDAHSDIVNEPSGAWDNMLAVIAGEPVTTYTPPDAVSSNPLLEPWRLWTSPFESGWLPAIWPR
ncbi:MAG: alpha/beta hydrolase [Mycobacterium sp.]